MATEVDLTPVCCEKGFDLSLLNAGAADHG